jgi:hypothetical protein
MAEHRPPQTDGAVAALTVTAVPVGVGTAAAVAATFGQRFCGRVRCENRQKGAQSEPQPISDDSDSFHFASSAHRCLLNVDLVKRRLAVEPSAVARPLVAKERL